MNYLFTFFLVPLMCLSQSSSQPIIVADFSNWKVVNDDVMGGRSRSEINLDSEGHAVFIGDVSLENYGGFASVRKGFNALSIINKTKVIIKLKGDGKNYQFRLKHNNRDYHTYVHTFSTTGEWEEVSIPLKIMRAQFRGRKLNMPNFNYDSIDEIGLLIANKVNEHFQLTIAKIEFH